MKHIYIGGQKVTLDPANAVGKGGEADVFKIGSGDQVVKIFKPPTHPDLVGDPIGQAMATARLREHQTKLREFPKGLPTSVVAPTALAFADKGETDLVGYTMPFVAGSEVLFTYHHDSKFRAGIRPADIVKVFQSLHATVSGVHKAGIVIGDFNDLNVIVSPAFDPRLLDADSMQFGAYLCRMFTARFVDPLLCDLRNSATLKPGESSLMLARPHNPFSDWYAFAIMLMECLLYVGPYGGVYKPKDPSKRIPHDTRPFQRVTVFQPEVVYPKPAKPFGILPDELLQYFHRVFEKDERTEFPGDLLKKMQWVTCPQCSTEHARGVCPKCAHVTPASVVQKTTIRGTVTATRIFPTVGGRGVILQAALQGNSLRWLYHENGAFKRENQMKVLDGNPDKNMKFRLSGDRTYIAMGGRLIACSPTSAPKVTLIDTNGRVPVYDTNADHVYWGTNGQLVRESAMGMDVPEVVGDILQGQTAIWAGPTFGFGFYRAGDLFQPFTFDAELRRSLNDGFKLPLIRGQLLDATCVFSSQRCWFLTTTQEGSRLVNRCVVLKKDGVIDATAEATAGDGSWLGAIRGGSAATLNRPTGPAHGLFVPTDAGIVLAEVVNGQIAQTRHFPDTEPFVDTATKLYFSSNGIYAVSPQEIQLIQMK